MLTLLGHEPSYLGKSTDTRPENPAPNTLIFNLDDATISYFDGDDEQWHVVGAGDEAPSTLQAAVLHTALHPIGAPVNAVEAISTEEPEEAEKPEEDPEETEDEEPSER
ncbi:MAG: hypothetical protein J6X14_00885 [Lachnospiraceae bacterium]|nr:hypothetical protein [Lachnospiraceae bacterium]MBP5668848.1 hypothetical protein [Lachnospiraceae bacterium]